MIDFRKYSYDLNLDLSESNFIPKIDMKQYDTKSRYIKIKLYNKGYEFDITDKDLSFKAIFRKPDGKEVFSSCEVVTGVENYLIIPVTANTLAAVGIITTELVILQNESIYSSKFFYINCLPSLHANKGNVESSDEYKGLLESILKVEQLLSDFNDLNSITVLHNVINVANDTKTLSFANWNEWTSNNSLEVYLSGVKQIEGIDFTLDATAKTITAVGNKTFRTNDQVLLCSLRRINSTEYKNPTISADKVTLTSNINGANNVQTALENMFIKFNDYLLISQYNNEVGDINDLQTNNKTIVGAINELKIRLDKLDNAGGNPITTYKKLSDTITLTAKAKSIIVPILDYDPNLDELNVYISGAKMVEGVAYELNKTLKMITCLNDMWDENVQIYFEVLKFT